MTGCTLWSGVVTDRIVAMAWSEASVSKVISMSGIQWHRTGILFPKVPWDHLAAEIGEGVCDLGVSIYEVAVKVAETQERLYISDIAGFWPQGYCCYFGGVHVIG